MLPFSLEIREDKDRNTQKEIEYGAESTFTQPATVEQCVQNNFIKLVSLDKKMSIWHNFYSIFLKIGNITPKYTKSYVK